jgi:hypothetical protein
MYFKVLPQYLFGVTKGSHEKCFRITSLLVEFQIRDLPNKNSDYSYTRVYPKFSVLATQNENCKWYSSLLLGAVVSLFCELVK